MTRLRKKACVALFLFTLFIFGTMMGLRSLKPSDGFSDLAPGMELMPFVGARVDRRPVPNDVVASAGQALGASDTKIVFSNSGHEHNIFYDIHIFYYLWYGTPQMDRGYIHWDHVLVPHWDPKIAASHPKGRHSPPEDIASSFYPELGPYSSRNPSVLESHMEQIESSAAGVVVLSWYPPGVADEHGEPTEDLVPAVMDAAHRHRIKVTGERYGHPVPHLQVAFHIQPYRGRTDLSVHDNVKYIIDKYGKHGAFYRFKSSTGKVLPLFYIYDSYLTPPEAWAELLTSRGSHSLRGTPYDGIFIALIVEERHKHDILASGFDGMYTYFASNGFSFGSSHQNWKALKAFCDGNGLLFVPSAGPGYVDTAVRPWNNHNTRNRVNGRYYETALQAAMSVRPDVITVTSFNEWHEGTQIERAVPKKTVARLYLDYKPHEPDLYLELTRKWAEQFNKEKEQWLM
ncbi:glycoprotein endo-alpha-1,2-mannosidase-like protein isoform X1 [Electrophorus electricus]|uniref:glycoprotein endo-alpha-1,2-mannosidase-like protein isoform X1 n=1 Tax=Electrophorus electricus TaxID=8005 RepID=UPI0015D071E9|nr:glycoprotein endo-alpha-1,2-mannosidase-like protein isoform X1 [Electrophorus electricus]